MNYSRLRPTIGSVLTPLSKLPVKNNFYWQLKAKQKSSKLEVTEWICEEEQWAAALCDFITQRKLVMKSCTSSQIYHKNHCDLGCSIPH